MAIARLQQASLSAVDVLMSVMTDTEIPPSVRLSAAKAVLDTSFRAAEIEDLEFRIAMLEHVAGLNVQR